MSLEEKKSVLVVDDDDYARCALERALSSAGYEASSAATGGEALAIL
ncbi:MAG: response regulator, partial [Acidobacteria bacterium]